MYCRNCTAWNHSIVRAPSSGHLRLLAEITFFSKTKVTIFSKKWKGIAVSKASKCVATHLGSEDNLATALDYNVDCALGTHHPVGLVSKIAYFLKTNEGILVYPSLSHTLVIALFIWRASVSWCSPAIILPINTYHIYIQCVIATATVPYPLFRAS